MNDPDVTEASALRRAAAAGMFALLLLLPSATRAADFAFMPRDHRALTRSATYDQMREFLESLDGKGLVRVTEAGRTTQGRSVFAVNLRRSDDPAWTILFYAQQHGDELSGKDALLYLIRDLAEDPESLPSEVDLWILPMMNPDGAEAGTRVNGAKADLNRDHMTLDQPETRALHDVVRRIRPDVAVDCHEFGRDSAGWRRRGLEKWPDITMDGLNNPLFDRALVEAGDRWVEEGAKAEAEAGHPFLRYWVGGTPPEEEQRHSAPDVDSAMNAIGAYGGLSFIIEAAARGGDDAIARELGNRVDAYLVLLRRFLAGDGRREQDRAVIEKARSRPIPPFLPVNYLWVNPDAAITPFPAIEVSSGKAVYIPTPNMMTTLAVKKSVPTPSGYAIEPGAAAAFAALLDRHAIPYESLAAPRTVEAEACTLLRVEEEFDEIYSRYEGRQIVRRAAAEPRELAAGSLWVRLAGPAALRAALLLEPASIYGLYQYPAYRALVGEGGRLPVLRVVR